MSNPKANVIKLPREHKLLLLDRIRTIIEDHTDAKLGELGAETLLDALLRELGPHVYNQALQDARTTLQQRWTTLEDDLYALEKPLR
ncbi:DUF2164 domain-containing protein [Paenibacillus chartarius]|uniref:DUF2164 domain-containing protein n=1 Tax=Paenibacillus chartarius TaxID=747481 RepID=A0ABV6DPE7_9BACL